MEIRSHIIQEKLLDPLRLYVAFLVSMLIATVLIRGIEILSIYDAHNLNQTQLNFSYLGLLNDFLFTLKLGAIIYPVFWFFFLILKPMSEFFCQFTLVVFVFIYLAIDKYFFVSLTPLGADFWGYSYDDIATTIKSSTDFKWLDSIAFVAFPFLILFIYRRLRRYYNPNPVYPFLVLFLLLSALLFSDDILKTSNDYKDETSYYLSENKAKYFMDKSLVYFAEEKNKIQKTDDLNFGEYPLLHNFDDADVLGPYLNKADDKPNLVFIQVEGLGKAFTGPGAPNGGFTPFLDSLAKQSLYWENCISPTGRTFGVLPNMYASLPFGSNGFNELGNEMPDHISLISQLKQEANYTCNYYYGGDVSFDKQDVFLDYQGVDYLLSEQKFPSEYSKMKANSGGFSWGYNDKDVFDFSLKLIEKQNASPRIDIYMTLVTHEPFKVPDTKYKSRFKDILRSIPASEKERYSNFSNIYECLLYTDDAIADFINNYRKRPEFSNTIFVITGDHRMIPIPHRNRIDRFHVPLLIWSPLLKKPKTFKNIVSLGQIAPTFLKFFEKNYGVSVPKEVAFINKSLSAKTEFGSDLEQPIMKNKGDLNIYISQNYFYDNGALYKILPKMELEKVSFSTKQKEIGNKLKRFKAINNYVCQNNALYAYITKSSNQQKIYSFNEGQRVLLNSYNSKNINSDSLLSLAQTLMKKDKDADAITLLQYTLNRSPNYADVRILLGKLYYWQDKAKLAEEELGIAVERSPQYKDAYRAFTDCLLDNGNYIRLSTVIDSAISIEPNYKYYGYLKAKSLIETNQTDSAKSYIDKALEKEPTYDKLLELKEELINL